MMFPGSERYSHWQYDCFLVKPDIHSCEEEVNLVRLQVFVIFISKSDIRTRKNAGYTSTYANNNLHTHQTPIANSFTYVDMLGLSVLG